MMGMTFAPPTDYLPEPSGYLPDPRLIVFDGALAALQDVPREVAEYALVLIDAELAAFDPGYPDCFRAALGLESPTDAAVALRYWRSIRAGDTIKACPLLKWMDDETGTLPLVRQAMHSAEAIINQIHSITQSGQEADSTRGTAP